MVFHHLHCPTRSGPPCSPLSSPPTPIHPPCSSSVAPHGPPKKTPSLDHSPAVYTPLLHLSELPPTTSPQISLLQPHWLPVGSLDTHQPLGLCTCCSLRPLPQISVQSPPSPPSGLPANATFPERPSLPVLLSSFCFPALHHRPVLINWAPFHASASPGFQGLPEALEPLGR